MRKCSYNNKKHFSFQTISTSPKYMKDNECHLEIVLGNCILETGPWELSVKCVPPMAFGPHVTEDSQHKIHKPTSTMRGVLEMLWVTQPHGGF